MYSLIGFPIMGLGKGSLSRLTRSERKGSRVKKILGLDFGRMTSEVLVKKTLEAMSIEQYGDLPSDIKDFIRLDLQRLSSGILLADEKAYFMLLFTNNLRKGVNVLEDLMDAGKSLSGVLGVASLGGEGSEVAKAVSEFYELRGEDRFPQLYRTCELICDIAGEVKYELDPSLLYAGLMPHYLSEPTGIPHGFLAMLYQVCVELKDVRPFMYIYHSHKESWNYGELRCLFCSTLERIDEYYLEQGVYDDLPELMVEFNDKAESVFMLESAKKYLDSVDVGSSIEDVKAAGNYAFGELLGAGFDVEGFKKFLYQRGVELFKSFNEKVEKYSLSCAPLTIIPDGKVRLGSAHGEVLDGWLNTLGSHLEELDVALSGSECKELVKLEEEKSDLEGQVESLSGDVLNNLAEINALAEEIALLGGKISELSCLFESRAEEFCGCIEGLYGDFYASFVEVEKVVAESSEGLTDAEMCELLAGEVDALKDECNDLKLALFKEKSKVSAPAECVAMSVPEAVVDAVADTLNTKTCLASIIKLVASINSSRVVISDSCLKNLEENDQFIRQQKLFKSLVKLTSAEFMYDYQSKGSLGAFQHFTKTELSFQESKPTKASGISRSFVFGGNEKDCYAHLRIGVDSKEQHMLRVYFTIENGKVYIGDVVKHLPVSSIK